MKNSLKRLCSCALLGMFLAVVFVASGYFLKVILPNLFPVLFEHYLHQDQEKIYFVFSDLSIEGFLCVFLLGLWFGFYLGRKTK